VSQTRAKAAVRGAKGKSTSGRRPPVKVKAGREIPLLPIVVGVILVLVAIALIVIAVQNANHTTSGPGQTVTGQSGAIPCDQLEQTKFHYHAALQILYQGTPVSIPSDVGRLATCFYWLHVHAESPGVIHIESPSSRKFTLGDFFKVWATSLGTPEPLDSTHVSSFTLTGDQKLVVYVDHADGKGPQLFTGDPKTIVLAAHEVITLEITPPTVSPPPTFTFQSGL
jgi:hypothetical protein